MAFESLSEKLSSALKKISGKGKLTEANMNDMLKEVRMSLLEADVNYQVVKDFINDIKEQAMGREVLESFDPGQMVVKIVRDELEKILGPDQAKLVMNDQGITSVMMVGLQGTGKTTAAAKIARFLKNKQNKKVLLAACDVVRPAAIEQLKTLGKQIDVEVFSLGAETPAVYTAKCAKEYAKEKGYDVIIFDTAGRLHIDEALMNELSEMKEEIQPQDILLTVDAMTGQDIVTVARDFNDKLDITGLVVTKMDGDARGGGLLSVRSITKVPVLFVSNGEKVEDLEEFHPDRMAARILGMGDMLTLIEQAQDKIDEKAAAESASRMMAGVFTFNDLLSQFEQMNKLGSFSGLISKIPGMGKMAPKVDDEKMSEQIKHMKALIQSMTPYEREHPECLKNSRKQRIARGAGLKVADLNKLIAQQQQMQQLSKMMSGGGFGNPFGNPFASMQRGGGMYGASKHSGSKKQKPSKKKKKKK
ncbi:signal recognition particle protein [Allobaculum sp. JKK-2023]|uniref:signal recognition particle protein n=1 Tax=Allobaculum sp. JKK-2023 TaxID=3108943 RepID=UPI002B057DCD|nr:signal recognition particle protein [Allobaculum sp. JKK-2023]